VAEEIGKCIRALGDYFEGDISGAGTIFGQGGKTENAKVGNAK